MSEDLSYLLPFATETQANYIAAIEEHGSARKAAAALGVHHSTISGSINAARRRAALRGISPEGDMSKTVPEPFFVKGVSSFYNKEGELSGQWVKTAVDREHLQALQREFVKELCETVVPVPPNLAAPIIDADDIEVVIPLGDHHFGMLAWGKETGDDWDTKLAKDRLEQATAHIIRTTPASRTAVFANLGDLLHSNDRSNRTPMSGHILDVDSRYARIIRFAAYGMCTSIEQLLHKHEIIKVINVPGNHDPDAASWVALVMEAYFRNEPRVIVETSPAKMIFHSFGKNMIAFTHGDTMKMDMIPGIMAALQPQLWGNTNYRVCHTGHVHTREKRDTREFRGAHVESHGVLPPSDAFGASLGYNSDRTLNGIVYHKDGGEMARSTFRIRS